MTEHDSTDRADSTDNADNTDGGGGVGRLRSLGARARDRLAGPRGRAPAVPDRDIRDRLARLSARVAVLEDAVEENRRLNQRLADVVDVVTEVLVPAADRDDERLRHALGRLNDTLED